MEIRLAREMHPALPGHSAGDARAACERCSGRVRRFRAWRGPAFPLLILWAHVQTLLRMCQSRRSVSGSIFAGFGKADNPA